MEQVSNYYTPTIEEFHVGFECESNYILFNREDDHMDFVPLTLTKDNISYMLDSYVNDAYPTEFRVKYLDKEDIESLGFEENSWSEEGQWLFNKDRFILTVVSSNNRVMITDRNRSTSSTDGKYYHYMLFDGTIKNKSELKVLLKQLGIDV